MKIVFVAYANQAMAYSLKRIGRQARKLGLFEHVILYTPDSLPEELKSSPLMQHSYGGGYWAWKPWIIADALRQFPDAAVCYVDAGCTLHKSTEWELYARLIEEYDTLLFHYPSEIPVWKKYGTTSTKIKHWTKKTAVEYYDKITGSQEWREHYKIQGAFVWMKGRDNPILHDWKDIVLNHPEIIDDSGVFDEQFPFFVRHKHDQPMLTALSCKYADRCLVLPELLDEGPAGAAVVCERVRVRNVGEYIVWCVKKVIRTVIGQNAVTALKKMVGK